MTEGCVAGDEFTWSASNTSHEEPAAPSANGSNKSTLELESGNKSPDTSALDESWPRSKSLPNVGRKLAERDMKMRKQYSNNMKDTC